MVNNFTKLEKGFISFKNFSRQLPVPFKIYAHFECILKERNSTEEIIIENTSYTKKHHSHIPCGFGNKVVCIDYRFSKDVVVYRAKTCINKFITKILEEYKYCTNVMKKHFNKNLIMTVEEEDIFQSSNKCSIRDKIFELVDEKVRDDCHISVKFRGAAHFSCNANLQITKKVPVIFHNLKGFDSHLIIKELSNFNVKVDVLSNGLEKCMAFTINKNLVFIDSMPFMNSSLDSLVKI